MMPMIHAACKPCAGATPAKNATHRITFIYFLIPVQTNHLPNDTDSGIRANATVIPAKTSRKIFWSKVKNTEPTHTYIYRQTTTTLDQSHAHTCKQSSRKINTRTCCLSFLYVCHEYGRKANGLNIGKPPWAMSSATSSASSVSCWRRSNQSC